MLEHAKIPYEHKSDFSEIASVCGAFGCENSTTFAPPVVQDGDTMVSQSTACCMYIGEKCGLVEGVDSPAKAVQFMADIIDAFENGLATEKTKGAPALKAYLEGPRFAKWLAHFERSIKGPFFFGGDKPTYVDFLFVAHVDWAYASTLDRLIKEKGLADPLAASPKVSGVVAGIRGLDSYKGYAGPLVTANADFVVKDEFLDAWV